MVGLETVNLLHVATENSTVLTAVPLPLNTLSCFSSAPLVDYVLAWGAFNCFRVNNETA